MALRVSDIAIDEMFQALAKEVVKTHSEYDGSGRLTARYEALANTLDNEVCLLTEYTYDGASTRVENSKESLSTWNSAWDL